MGLRCQPSLRRSGLMFKKKYRNLWALVSSVDKFARRLEHRALPVVQNAFLCHCMPHEVKFRTLHLASIYYVG